MNDEGSTAVYPCPACGFEVFDAPPGSYGICPVCGWEDDDVQLRFPTMQGGANKECLVEYQQETLRSFPLAKKEHKHFRRDPGWRPVTKSDCQDINGIPTNGQEYFEAAGEVDPGYYWRKCSQEDESRTSTS
ncbi:MAG: hypothetical protein HY924_16890 [Elusimicrobia bacterium]|nr:hypothetical protein [Elusimicrobiota bacterium]